ncbi:MAG: hypothetical protein O2856_10055, partial [Planctomycetota bacterium]|nr:hypothetical protein [Planctomycetota bacterium]
EITIDGLQAGGAAGCQIRLLVNGKSQTRPACRTGLLGCDGIILYLVSSSPIGTNIMPESESLPTAVQARE